MNKEIIDKLFSTATSVAEMAGRAADRSLEVTQAISQSSYSNLRENLAYQTDLLKTGLAAKNFDDLVALPAEALQRFQAQTTRVQQAWAILSASYFEDMVKFSETQKQQIQREAEVVKATVQNHFPSGAEAISLTLDSWMDFATRGFAQATEHGRKINHFSQQMAQIPAAKSKAKSSVANS